VLIICDGGAECSKALSCWNCSLITAAMTCAGGHSQACHQDMQWMVLNWHVEVVAVLSSKDTTHNARDVLSSNILLIKLHGYTVHQTMLKSFITN